MAFDCGAESPKTIQVTTAPPMIHGTTLRRKRRAFIVPPTLTCGIPSEERMRAGRNYEGVPP